MNILRFDRICLFMGEFRDLLSTTHDNNIKMFTKALHDEHEFLIISV